MLQADPEAVLAFLAVVEHKSFREAARVMRVPKSTLSQRVSQLEAQLGVRLLARTTRSLALTDIGASYHREVAPAVEAMRAAELVVQNLKAHPSGLVRMSAPVELGQSILPPVLSRYHASYPDVRVEVSLSDRHVNLVEEGYDLAIRVGPLTDSGLVARRWGEQQHLGVYGSRAYLRRAGSPGKPADLVHFACLAMSGARSWSKWEFRKGRGSEFVEFEPLFAVNSFLVLRGLVENGLGLGRLPNRFAQPLVDRKLIREVLAGYAMPPRDSFLVYPSARHVSPAVRAMIDLLLEQASSLTNLALD